MQNDTVRLMGELGRLLSSRSQTPRGEALGIAHRKIREYAAEHGHGERWCDEILLMFLSKESRAAAA